MTDGDRLDDPRSRHPDDVLTQALPHWSAGTVAVLSTIGSGTVHAIPVSTALRAGPLRIVFALSRRRGSLTRLRDDPRAALTLLDAGNVAITAHGVAAVITESLAADENIAAIALSVERISDHTSRDSEVLAGARWRWRELQAHAREAQVLDELRSLDVSCNVPALSAPGRREPFTVAGHGRANAPALVVIDVQNGFVNERTEPALPLISALIEHWQAKRWPVVFTRFHNGPLSAYERWLGWTGLRDDEETALHDHIARHAGTIIDKTTYTAFTKAGEAALAVQAGDTLVICGLDTDGCVLKTALDAFERDVRPVIAIDACATDGGPAAQQAARLVLERVVGPGQVLATADVLAWSEAELPAS
jgi:nicotinamidase-related amidase